MALQRPVQRPTDSEKHASELGRQYIGEIGKTHNGIVTVTNHYYDGKKSFP